MSNVHAESGGDQADRDQRVKQFEYMSRMHEFEEGRICVLAGDFNAREGEDHCLRTEGWRDICEEAMAPGGRSRVSRTWRRGPRSQAGPTLVDGEEQLPPVSGFEGVEAPPQFA